MLPTAPGTPPAPPAPQPAPRPLPDRAALLAAGGGDPFVRWELDPALPVRAWALPGAWAFLRPRPGGRGRALTVLGSPEAAGQLLAAALRLLEPADEVGALTLVRGCPLPAGAGGGDDWDWFWTCEPPPPQPGEDAVEVLGEEAASAAEVGELLRRASPRHSARPGGAGVRGWVGVRAGGRLVACAAHTENVPGVPHLASVATDPRLRGRGLGAAVTAALTRRLLAAGAPAVTLGMYADNAVARRLYGRLGFVREHALSSRALV